MGSSPLARMTGIRKRFGPIEVLRGVDLEIRAGEVHILAGENGAGKSTLLKVLCGVHADAKGTIEVRGRPVRPRSTQEGRALGIAMIHQELSLVPLMSVEDNLLLGRHPSRAGFVRARAARRAAQRALDLVGLGDLDPAQPAGTLPVSVRQRIEIAKALRLDASVIVMDEPTSALAAPEAERLFALIERLREEGRGIVFISHRMEEIQRIGDRVTVLRDGRNAGAGPIESFPEDRLIACMVGRELGSVRVRDPRPLGAERLRVETLELPPSGRRAPVRGVSLAARAGEIVGVAGLQGSGASELLGAIFGAFGPPASGRVLIDEEPIEVRDPRRSIGRGLALVTNDRKATGLVPGMSVTANATLAALDRLTAGGWRRPGLESRLAREAGERMDLRVSSYDAPVAVLSGGNQQKVTLAKWLATEPRVLLLDEPTRGIDLGAKRDVYAVIQRWTERGIAILLLTSELPELLGLSDRLVVMHRGRVTARLERDEATPETVLAAAMGRVREAGAA